MLLLILLYTQLAEADIAARRISDPNIYCHSVEWAPTLGGLLAILSTGDIALLRIQENERTNWVCFVVLSFIHLNSCWLSNNDVDCRIPVSPKPFCI
ncbi:hypothetical protein AHF37_12483 [Paragonimus kellicotti]|nr:hypothetical protein AHF37_12483 [Paragonimus kellicotti]